MRCAGYWRAETVIAAVGFFVGAEFASVEALAQDANDSRMSATAFVDFPYGETLEVRPGNDRAIDRDVALAVADRLRGRGLPVVQKGRVIVIVAFGGAQPGIESRQAFTNEDRLRTMDLNKKNRALLVPLNRGDKSIEFPAHSLRMYAYRPGQTNMWVGSAEVADRGQTPMDAALRMAGALSDRIGQAVPETAVPDAPVSEPPR